MSKCVEHYDDDDSDSPTSECVNGCESEHPCLQKNASAELDITSEESLSFSLQDASSLCEDLGDVGLSPNYASVTKVGSTVFQDFLLCFAEQNQLNQQLALRDSSSSGSTAERLRLRNVRASQAQALCARRQQVNHAFSVVSLPQLFLQPEGGLCCHADNNINFKSDEELILFDELFADSDDDNCFLDDGSLSLNDDKPLLQPSSRRSSLVDDTGTQGDPRKYVPRPSSTTPGLRRMSHFFRNLSSPEDKLETKHVWEPAVFDAEKPQSPATVMPPRDERECAVDDQTQPPDLAPGHQEFPRPSLVPTDLVSASKTLKSAITPSALSRFLHRRSRSELKTSTTAVPPSRLNSDSRNATGPSLQWSRTEDNLGANVSNASENGGKKGKGLLMSFLRRSTRIPSFRKAQQLSHMLNNLERLDDSMVGKPDTARGSPNGDERSSADDVANILASLEDTLDTLKQQAQSARFFSPSPQKSETLSTLKQQAQSAMIPAPSPQKILASLEDSLKQQAQSARIPAQSPQKSEPVSTLGSGCGETHSLSDNSSLFGGIESDDENESCSSDDTKSADKFFASPYYASQSRWKKEITPSLSTERKPLFGQPLRHYIALEEDKPYQKEKCDAHSLMSSATELTRCSSVDTAKASNLSCDPFTDRARLLEIQAYLLQQQEERQKRLSAPPIEFETGDNVIHVREADCVTIDAACEIEVLPKREICQDEEYEDPLPPTAAEI